MCTAATYGKPLYIGIPYIFGDLDKQSDLHLTHARCLSSSYSQITSSEQRSKYKVDFNEEYSEYRQLHCNLQEKTHIFHELKDKLRLEQERHMEENIEVRIDL